MKKLFLLIVLFLAYAKTFAIAPWRDYLVTPTDMGITNVKYHTITTADDKALQAWIFNADAKMKKNITLVFAYGDYGNMSQWILPAVDLSKYGYDVVCFDYRGFGGSADFPMDESYLYYHEFALDLEATVRWAKQQYAGQKLGVLAFSTGSLIAVEALQKVSVDFLVADGFIINIERFKKLYQDPASPLKLPTKIAQTLEQMKVLKTPLLIFAGSRDKYVAVNEIHDFVSLNRNKRELGIYNGLHAESLWVLRDKWIARLDLFLKNKALK
jgi:alpha-beta hydrolase superfamily lysophospholipase